jgi:hypothetical protein
MRKARRTPVWRAFSSVVLAMVVRAAAALREAAAAITMLQRGRDES